MNSMHSINQDITRHIEDGFERAIREVVKVTRDIDLPAREAGVDVQSWLRAIPSDSDGLPLIDENDIAIINRQIKEISGIWLPEDERMDGVDEKTVRKVLGKLGTPLPSPKPRKSR